MIDVIAIQMEVGYNHLEHITKLKWVEVDKPGGSGKTQPKIATRTEMYDFVRDNPRQAFAISQNDNKWAYLEAVDAHVQYVKTLPDSTKADNLLSLPRFK